MDDELDVLLPGRDVTIAGCALRLREYTLTDTLALHSVLSPLTDALAGVMADGWPEYEDVADILAAQGDALITLMAHAIDRPTQWVAMLPGTEGLALQDWWWSVNRGFFMNAVVRRLALREARRNRSLLPASSPRSSAPVIPAQSLDATRSGS